MYQWAVIENRVNGISHSFSLLEIENGKAEFLASINMYPDSHYNYQFYSWNKERTQLFECIPPAINIRMAQGIIVNHLKHIKVLPRNYMIPKDELYVEERYKVELK